MEQKHARPSDSSISATHPGRINFTINRRCINKYFFRYRPPIKTMASVIFLFFPTFWENTKRDGQHHQEMPKKSHFLSINDSGLYFNRVTTYSTCCVFPHRTPASHHHRRPPLPLAASTPRRPTLGFHRFPEPPSALFHTGWYRRYFYSAGRGGGVF